MGIAHLHSAIDYNATSIRATPIIRLFPVEDAQWVLRGQAWSNIS